MRFMRGVDLGSERERKKEVQVVGPCVMPYDRLSKDVSSTALAEQNTEQNDSTSSRRVGRVLVITLQKHQPTTPGTLRIHLLHLASRCDSLTVEQHTSASGRGGVDVVVEVAAVAFARLSLSW
jgi:hypothetical protein